MKNLIFDFNKLASGDSAPKQAMRYFSRAGANVVQYDAPPVIKRSSGITYREMTLTFADSQQVVLRIKQSGDIFQVVLNGKTMPIKNQDDHVKAIAEMVQAMDSGRSKFQKSLANAKVRPPAGIRTAAPKMEQALTEKRDALKEAITSVRSQIAKMKGQVMDGVQAVLDAAGAMTKADAIEAAIKRYVSGGGNEKTGRVLLADDMKRFDLKNLPAALVHNGFATAASAERLATALHS